VFCWWIEMAIVLRHNRPALPVVDGTFEAATDPAWRDVLERARPLIQRAISAVGRVLVTHEYMNWVGTAFVVDERLVVTSAHLARIFVQGIGDSGVEIRAEYAPKLELPAATIPIARVRFVHPHFDVAVLELEHASGVDGLQLSQYEPGEKIELALIA